MAALTLSAKATLLATRESRFSAWAVLPLISGLSALSVAASVGVSWFLKGTDLLL